MSIDERDCPKCGSEKTEVIMKCKSCGKETIIINPNELLDFDLRVRKVVEDIMSECPNCIVTIK